MYKGPVASVSLNDGSIDMNTKRRYRLYGVPQVSPVSRGLVVAGFQGSGVLDGTYVSDILGASKVLSSIDTASKIASIIQDSTGSFTLQMLDTTTGSFYFLNDPLGGGFIIEYSDGDNHAVGVDVISLKIHLAQLNISITRSIEYQISGFATGTNSFAKDMPYDELTAVPPGYGIVLNADGEIHKFDYGINNYINSPNNKSYDELLYMGTAAILRNVDAAAKIDADFLLSDITGGFDSRLVLSAIMGAGHGDRFLLSSIHGNPEWSFAEGLSSVSGIGLTKNRGLIASIHQPLNYYESCVAGSRASGGVIPNDLHPGELQSR